MCSDRFSQRDDTFCRHIETFRDLLWNDERIAKRRASGTEGRAVRKREGERNAKNEK